MPRCTPHPHPRRSQSHTTWSPAAPLRRVCHLSCAWLVYADPLCSTVESYNRDYSLFHMQAMLAPQTSADTFANHATPNRQTQVRGGAGETTEISTRHGMLQAEQNAAEGMPWRCRPTTSRRRSPAPQPIHSGTTNPPGSSRSRPAAQAHPAPAPRPTKLCQKKQELYQNACKHNQR